MADSSTHSDAVTIAYAQNASAVQPYKRMFYGAMESLGIHTVGIPQISNKWLTSNQDHVDAIHLHRPESLWRISLKARLGVPRAVVSLVLFVRQAHRQGKLIIWTVHNLAPHDGTAWVDRFNFRLLARNADLLICHAETTRQDILRRWRPRCPVLMMPHGNFKGIYPSPRDRTQVLSELGLDPSRPMVCCVGGIRQYKGIEVAVEAIGKLAGQVQLVVAGGVHPAFDIASLAASVSSNRDVALITRELSEQEFSDIIGASEAVLLPYHHITGSGAMMAALTLGRGVIASDLPYFHEFLAGDPFAGRLFSAANPDHLACAIQEFLSIPAQSRNAAAGRLAAQYDWDRVVPPVAEAVTALVRSRRGRWA